MSQQPPSQGGRLAHPLWRAVKIASGFTLLGLGVVGLFLPFLQGVLFMLVGLALLSSESRRLRGFLERLRRRYPEVHAMERHLIERVTQRIREKFRGGSR